MGIFRHIGIWGIVLQTAVINVYGQISSATADKDTVTSYQPADPIFIFNQYPSPKPGTLMATNPFGGSATFEWSHYDTVSFSFSAPFQTDTNTLSSVAGSLTRGGYRVTIKSAGKDTTLMAWVFLNNFSMKLNKDNKGNLMIGYVYCSYIDILDTSLFTNFTYYDTADVSHSPYLLSNQLAYSWSANPALSFPLSSINSVNTSDLRIGGDKASPKNVPPAKNTWFALNVTDLFNLTKSDSLYYPTIQTKALFRMKYAVFYYDSTSAPVTVTFIDSSENAKTYQWFFPGATPDTALSKNPGTRTFYESGKYIIKLITTSPSYCVDTTRDTLSVSKAHLSNDSSFSVPSTVPTAFMPEKGNFKVYVLSIKAFHITIFSRWGKVVYSDDGLDLQKWDGWDGKVNGNNDASPGVYYYIITVKTWDPAPNSNYINTNGEYKGYFYLFR